MASADNCPPQTSRLLLTVVVVCAVLAAAVGSVSPVRASEEQAGLPNEAARIKQPASEQRANRVIVDAETRASAEALRSGERSEVLPLRTESSQVFALPSGAFVEERFAQPHWVRKNSTLVEIDTGLVSGEVGLQPRAAEVDMVFSAGGTTSLVTIERDNQSISLEWPTPLPPPIVEHDIAIYPEVFPGIDLKLRAMPGGFSQVLVLRNAKAAERFARDPVRYGIRTRGLTISSDRAGNIKATNSAGQELFTGPTPRMWDSSRIAVESIERFMSLDETGPQADQFEPQRGAKQAPMRMSISKSELVLTPDRNLLADPTTKYPVVIDPFVSGSRAAWTIAYKPYPTTAYFNGAGWGGSTTTIARVGYEAETNGTARSIFRMDAKNLWNTNKQILNSTFRIKNSYSWSCTKRTVELWLTGSISASTTWNNQPSWSRKLASVNDAKGWSSSCPAGNLSFDVTSAAKEAVTKHWNDITMGLRASSETDTYGWKKFEAATAVLSTEYNTIPNDPTGVDTIPSTNNGKDCGITTPHILVGSTDVYLSAKVSDPDGGTMKARFMMWPYGNDSLTFIDTTVSVTSGSVAKLKVTRDTLKSHMSQGGGKFTWQAQAQDATSSSEWVPGAGINCHFAFDPDRPSHPPVVSSAEFPNGDNGWPTNTSSVRTAGNFTIANGGVTDVAKYEYWTNWDATHRTITLSSVGASATVKLSPTTAGPNQLYVKSYDKAANSSDTAVYLFYANGPKQPDKPGDLNGDGNADLWAMDKLGTLHRYYGTGDGSVAEASATASNRDWGTNGTSLITHRGDWTDDGYEDLVALYPDAALGKKRMWIHANNGYGFACTDCSNGVKRQELTVYDQANDHWQGATQILAVGDVDGPLDTDGDGIADLPGFPDLLVKEGGRLWLYFGSPDYRLDAYRDPVLLADSGYSDFTLAAPGDLNMNGHVDLLARQISNGDMFAYFGTGPNGEGLTSTATHARVGWSWGPASVPLFVAAPDANNNGKPDVWGTTPNSPNLRFWPDFTTTAHGAAKVVAAGFSEFQSLG